MLLSVPQSARRAYTQRLSEKGISIQLLCLLLCFHIVPYTAQEAYSGKFKAVFKTPWSETMKLRTAIQNLTEFTVCTFLKLDVSSKWTAFTYKSESGTKLELSGDNKVIDIWIFDTKKNIKENLNNKKKWYEICILWYGKKQLMEFYLDGNPKESFYLGTENILTGGGSLSLGCPPGEKTSASEELLELYMFRLWDRADSSLLKSCTDGNVIQWNINEWTYSTETVVNDSTLNCEDIVKSFTPSSLQTTSATTSTTTLTTLTPSTTSAKTQTSLISSPAFAKTEPSLISFPASAQTETFLTTATTSAKTQTSLILSPSSAKTETSLTPATTSAKTETSLTPLTTSATDLPPGTSHSGNGTTLLSSTGEISASINNTTINVTVTYNATHFTSSSKVTTNVIDSSPGGYECQLNDSLIENVCRNFTHCNYSAIYEFTLNEDENVCKSLEKKFMDEPEDTTLADSTFSPMTSFTDGNLGSTTDFTETQNTSDITNASTGPTTSPSISFSIETTTNIVEPEATSTNSTESIFTSISTEPTSNISSKNKTCTFMVGAKRNETKCDVISKINSENKTYTISKIRELDFCCCFSEECPTNITAINSSNCNFSEINWSCGSGGSGGNGGNDQTSTTTTKATTSLTTATTKATTSLTTTTTKATTSLTRATTKASTSLTTTTTKATTSLTRATTKASTSTPITSIIPSNIGEALEKLNDTLSSDNLNETEVKNAVTIIEDILTGDVSPEDAKQLLNLIDKFLNLTEGLIIPVAKRLIMIVDRIGLKLAFNGSSINITSNSLAVAVKKINATSFNETSFGVDTSDGLQVSLGSQEPTNSAGTIVLPAALLNGLAFTEKANVSRIQFNFYNNTKLFRNTSQSNPKLTLVSKVISASVGNLSLTNLMENVTVTLKINGKKNASLQCVFWNFNLNDSHGGWDSDGCTAVNMTENEAVCTCNHLTSFAILMDVSIGKLSPEDLLRLTFISYIGCGISAIFLSVTMVTYIAFEKIRRDYPSKILIQLCAALIGLNLSFLLSPWIALYNEIPGLCIAAAAFLHYFVLVSITWMGLEAFHMYLSLVKVFNTYVRKYMLKFCIVGWGCPAIVVAIVLAVNRTLYRLEITGKFPDGSEDLLCWIDRILFYITVVGYFAIIFLLNVSMFIVVLIQLCRIKKQKQIGYQRKTTFQDLRSVAGITFLLGITWGLGFFSLGHAITAISYIFAILNSLQGFFIFLFYCVAKENVRKQWRRYLCCGKLRLAENSDWSKTTTNKLKKQTSKQGASSNSSNSIQSNTNSNSTSLLVSNEYFHPNGNGNAFKERNGGSIMGPNGNVPFYDISVVHFYKNGNTQTASIRRTSNKAGVHFMEQT